jgi:hypothetical protein
MGILVGLVRSSLLTITAEFMTSRQRKAAETEERYVEFPGKRRSISANSCKAT